MRREWELDDLIASWTLVDADQELLVGKHDVPRLSCAVMVKFFEIEGRFPRHVGEVPPSAVDYLARQLGLTAGQQARFEVTGRSAERFRMQIRDVFGFRVFARGDEDKMVEWLAEQVCPSELNANPTYQVVAGAVGLLVFLNVVNQLILFAAALTATGAAGQVSDLAHHRSAYRLTTDGSGTSSWT